MLTKITIKNFKKFKTAEIELANPVVFIGPNNSGKTTALQALSLWYVGVRKWYEKRGDQETPGTRTGVPINRNDLLAAPVPNAKLIWRDLHVKSASEHNILIEIIVEGITKGKEWRFGLEFYYNNEEAFYCKPIKINNSSDKRMAIPPEALKIKVALLPPMSGLATRETRLDEGAVNVRIGEGRTAEVLRNLCYRIFNDYKSNPALNNGWISLNDYLHKLFLINLNDPIYIEERGEIEMTYKDMHSKVNFDITSAGRGLHQILLLLAYLYSNPNSVLMLDEPDAHLEIIRQREIYRILSDLSREKNCQVLAASHSEILLNEAAEKDSVVVFVGNPHLINSRSQAYKCLATIGFDQYYLAEEKGWVLYLEGSTDLSILQTFSNILNHKSKELLERPFLYEVSDQPKKAQEHFYGLYDAYNGLKAVALFDNRDNLPSDPNIKMLMWERREIENYICFPEALLAYASSESEGDLFSLNNVEVMDNCLKDLIPPIAYSDRDNRWWKTVKASDDFLDLLFEEYYKRLGLPNLMRKSNYHKLAQYLPVALILPEIKIKLDSIFEVAKSARGKFED